MYTNIAKLKKESNTVVILKIAINSLNFLFAFLGQKLVYTYHMTARYISMSVYWKLLIDNMADAMPTHFDI